MEKIIKGLTRSFSKTNGAFLIRHEKVPKELQDIYDQVYLTLDGNSIREDKVNMHGDVKRLKSDFKKAVNDKKMSISNG